jgi:hypothetical protein
MRGRRAGVRRSSRHSARRRPESSTDAALPSQGCNQLHFRAREASRVSVAEVKPSLTRLRPHLVQQNQVQQFNCDTIDKGQPPSDVLAHLTVGIGKDEAASSPTVRLGGQN